MSTQSSPAAGTPSVVLPSACILPPSPPPSSSALSSSSSSSISSSVPACVSYSPSSSSLTYSSSMLTVDIVLNELGALDHSFNDSTSSGSTTTTSGSSSPGSPNGSFMLDFDSPTPTPSPTSSSSSSAASGSSSSITSSSSSLSSSSSGQLVSSPPPPSDESAPATPFSESDDISVPTSPGGTPLHASLPFKKAKTPRVPLTAIATLGKTLIQGDSLEKTSVFSFLEQLGQSGTNFDKYKDKIKKKPSAGTKRKKGKSSRHGKKARGERKSKKSRKSKQPKDSTTADGSDDKENTPAVSASSSSAPSSSSASSSASSSSASASAPNAAALHQQKQQQLSHQQHNHLVDNNANDNGGHRHAHHRHHHKDETGKKAASPPRPSSSSSSSSASGLNRPYHAAAPSKPATSRPKSPRRKPAPQHNPSPGGRFFEHSAEEMMMVSPRGSREHGDVLSQHRGSMLPAPPQFGRHPDPRRMQPQLPFPLLPSPVPQQPPHLAHLSHPQHHNHQASPPHLHFGGGASGAFPAFSAPQSSGGGGGMLPGLPLPWPVPQTSGSHPFLLPSTPPTSSVAGDQQSGGGGHQQHHQQGQQHQHQHQHQHPHQHQQQQNNQLAGFDISSIFAASAGGNYDSSEAIDLSSLLNDAADVVGEKGETAMSGDGIPFQWAMSHPHNQQEEFLLEMSEMLAGGAGGWPAGAQQQHSDQGQHQDQHHDVGNAGPHGQMLVSDINLWFS